MKKTKTKKSITFPPYEVTCLKGSDEIGDFIKEDKNKIADLVKNERLPAWKRDGKGPWRALNVDLYNWLMRQRSKYLPKAVRDAEIEQKTT